MRHEIPNLLEHDKMTSIFRVWFGHPPRGLTIAVATVKGGQQLFERLALRTWEAKAGRSQ